MTTISTPNELKRKAIDVLALNAEGTIVYPDVNGGIDISTMNKRLKILEDTFAEYKDGTDESISELQKDRDELQEEVKDLQSALEIATTSISSHVDVINSIHSCIKALVGSTNYKTTDADVQLIELEKYIHDME